MTSTRPTLARAALLAMLVAAHPRAPAAAPDEPWHGNVAVGGAFASGSTNSTVLTGSADATRTTAADKLNLSGNVNYGRSKVDGVETTTADQLRAAGRYDYNLSDALFVFGGADGETNKAAGVDTRYNLDTGLGCKMIQEKTTTFDVFAGLGYTDAKFTDASSGRGATGVLGEESTHKLSATTTFKQRAEFHPGAHDIGNFATLDASLATAISGGWTLDTGLTVHYASKVPAGLKATESLLTVGFGYKF